MPYAEPNSDSHLYTVFFAPRGYARLATLGSRIAQQYLSPFDKLIGLVGDAGSGKSMLIKGMFPGLELTNDDEGVNVRPLPLLSAGEESGFQSAHTYHLDVRFEAAFTQMHILADAVRDAIDSGKRVVVEHFDLLYPALDRNAHLLIGIGEEVVITRPTLFGPEPTDIHDIVYQSIIYRRMTHTAEDLCEFFLKEQTDLRYYHADVRHGFILSFVDRPSLDIPRLQAQVDDMIAHNARISFLDDNHIKIGDTPHPCSGPRMHVKSAGEIGRLTLSNDLLEEPITGRHLLVGLVGEQGFEKMKEINKIKW